MTPEEHALDMLVMNARGVPLDSHCNKHITGVIKALIQRAEWTTEKPTKPGWYWWCEFRDPIPAYVSKGDRHWHVSFNGHTQTLELTNGHWMPITVPEPPAV